MLCGSIKFFATLFHFIFFFNCFCLFVWFWERAILCNPGQPKTYPVNFNLTIPFSCYPFWKDYESWAFTFRHNYVFTLPWNSVKLKEIWLTLVEKLTFFISSMFEKEMAIHRKSVWVPKPICMKSQERKKIFVEITICGCTFRIW